MKEAEILAEGLKTLSPQEMMEVINAHHSVMTCLHGLSIGQQALAVGLACLSVRTHPSAINCTSHEHPSPPHP